MGLVHLRTACASTTLNHKVFTVVSVSMSQPRQLLVGKNRFNWRKSQTVIYVLFLSRKSTCEENGKKKLLLLGFDTEVEHTRFIRQVGLVRHSLIMKLSNTVLLTTVGSTKICGEINLNQTKNSTLHGDVELR